MKSNSCDISICHSDYSINVPPNNAENGAEAWTIARLSCWWWNAHCTKPFWKYVYKHFFSVLNAKEMNIFSWNQFTHRPLETETQTKFMHLVLCTEGEYNFFRMKWTYNFRLTRKQYTRAALKTTSTSSSHHRYLNIKPVVLPHYYDCYFCWCAVWWLRF